jgi:POT family proton-dependent oligopeptide transporter
MAGGVEPPKPEYPHEEHGEIASLSNDGEEPTEEERRTLRKVSDKLPWAAFIICVIELCERFTYYGLSGPFQNYIENSYGGRVPGAIGLGQTGATGLTDFFQFWCYVCPVSKTEGPYTTSRMGALSRSVRNIQPDVFR